MEDLELFYISLKFSVFFYFVSDIVITIIVLDLKNIQLRTALTLSIQTKDLSKECRPRLAAVEHSLIRIYTATHSAVFPRL